MKDNLKFMTFISGHISLSSILLQGSGFDRKKKEEKKSWF